MAVKEITEHDYNQAKQDLTNGETNDWVAEFHGYGLRRVRLIRKSKSYKSYLALRRVERQKVAQNTPAKPTAGAHELAQEPPVVDSVVDQITETPPAEGKTTSSGIDEVQTLPPITVKVQPKRRKQSSNTLADAIFYTILTFAVIGFVVTVAFILFRVF